MISIGEASRPCSVVYKFAAAPNAEDGDQARVMAAPGQEARVSRIRSAHSAHLPSSTKPIIAP